MDGALGVSQWSVVYSSLCTSNLTLDVLVVFRPVNPSHTKYPSTPPVNGEPTGFTPTPTYVPYPYYPALFS